MTMESTYIQTIDHMSINDTDTGEAIVSKRGHSPQNTDSYASIRAEGHVLITDSVSGEVILDKKNAIHFENFAEAIALCMANRPKGNIHEMVFGNGGSTVDGTGELTYFLPNTTGQDSTLYNPTYSKVVDDNSPLNADKTKNNIRVQHTQNTTFADILITCTLDYGEPSDQDITDDAVNMSGKYIFDEIGIRSFDTATGNGRLLTHVIFHPVQKSRNRSFEILYTIRILMG